MRLFRLIRGWVLLLSRPESAGRDARPAFDLEGKLDELGLDERAVAAMAVQHGWSESSERRVVEKLGFDPGPLHVTRQSLWFHLARVGVAGTVLVASFFFVVGAIWEGHSALFGEQRVMALFTLALLLLVLGVFEGLQISVALLRFKDIETFDAVYPRAAQLHRWFRTESGTRRFLAGRQFFVVFVVFFIARTTSFPDLRHLPLLGTPLPSSFEALWFGLFDLGLAGALLVLWVAQLAPQFGANREPLAFLELPGMGPALRASFVVDETGVTLPGFWFSSWVPERRRIPNSRSERYRLAREEGIGAAAELVRHRLIVDSDGTLVRVEKRLQLAKGGFVAFDDRSLAIGSPEVETPRFEFELVRDGQRIEGEQTLASHRVDDDTAWTFELSLDDQAFESGDQVILTAEVECGELREHTLTFAEPTRLVHFVIEFENVDEVAACKAWVQRFDAHLPDTGPKTSLAVSSQGGSLRAEHFCLFPRPGEVLRFHWRTDEEASGHR